MAFLQCSEDTNATLKVYRPDLWQHAMGNKAWEGRVAHAGLLVILNNGITAHRAKYRGGQGTLKSSAWEVLKHNPKGLDAKELIGQIGKFGEFEVNDVSGVSLDNPMTTAVLSANRKCCRSQW